MTEAQAKLISPLRLAYIGDTVWEMLIRMCMLSEGRNVRHMHLGAVAGVNAAAQAASMQRIEGMLSEAESDIVRRGRNAHARHPAPKHQQQADYQTATGLEALMGFLYLTGREERLKELFHASQQSLQEDDPCRKQS